MRNVSKFAIGLLLSAMVLGLTLPSASASFYHPRGILTALNDQTMTIHYNAPGSYSLTLVLAIMPPWYFVPNLHGFDTVTLTVRLITAESIGCCFPANPKTATGSPEILGSPHQWSNMFIDETEEGFVGAVLYHTVTFVITSNTRPGYYLLYLNAQATAGDVTFVGFDQVAVAIKQDLLCFLIDCS